MRYLPPMPIVWLVTPGAAAAEQSSDITIIGWAHYLMVGRLVPLANASFGPTPASAPLWSTRNRAAATGTWRGSSPAAR